MEPKTNTGHMLDCLAHEFVEACKKHGLENVTEAIVVILAPDFSEILGIHSEPGPHHRIDKEIEDGYRLGTDLTDRMRDALNQAATDECVPGTVLIDFDATGTAYDACIKFKPYDTDHSKVPVILFNDPTASFQEYCEKFKSDRDLVTSLMFLVEHTVKRFIPNGFDVSVEVLRK